jgi:hypothetical protein
VPRLLPRALVPAGGGLGIEGLDLYGARRGLSVGCHHGNVALAEDGVPDMRCINGQMLNGNPTESSPAVGASSSVALAWKVQEATGNQRREGGLAAAAMEHEPEADHLHRQRVGQQHAREQMATHCNVCIC